MVLINCNECSKEISDKAASCPNCGNPIATKVENEEYLCCPHCKSKELHSEKKGFSGGKALAGAVLTGGIGLLAGTIGSRDIQITCLKCGKRFKAGEALITTVEEEKKKEQQEKENLEKEIRSMIESGNTLAAVKIYKDRTGTDLDTAKSYVGNFVKDNNITPVNSPVWAKTLAAILGLSKILCKQKLYRQSSL